MDGSHTATYGSSASLIWFGKVKTILSAGGVVEFTPRGHSMWPAILPETDTVRVISSPEYRPSDIVLALCVNPPGVFLHRISRIESGEAVLMGDSNLRQTEQCPLENIAGKVIAVSRNGRDVYRSPVSCLLARIQRLPAPLRRFAVRILNFRRNGLRRS